MTIYLANVASRRTPGMYGTGKVWSIQAMPPRWARGEGRVIECAPFAEWLRRHLILALAERKRGVVGGPQFMAYKEAFIAGLAEYDLRPGALRATPWYDSCPRLSAPVLVADGDTLVCTCSIAEAQAGRCHRSWCCESLAKAGWNVIIDGVPFVSGAAK